MIWVICYIVVAFVVFLVLGTYAAITTDDHVCGVLTGVVSGVFWPIALTVLIAGAVLSAPITILRHLLDR